MKLDWDCARALLIALEGLGDNTSVLRSHELQGFDAQKAAYHMQLLIEAGLIHGQCSTGQDDGMECHATRMSWAGHQLLDSIRSTTIWNKVKQAARERGLSLTLDAIKALAKHYLEALLP
jgi:Hypothetical protein (DUF2513)